MIKLQVAIVSRRSPPSRTAKPHIKNHIFDVQLGQCIGASAACQASTDDGYFLRLSATAMMTVSGLLRLASLHDCTALAVLKACEILSGCCNAACKQHIGFHTSVRCTRRPVFALRCLFHKRKVRILNGSGSHGAGDKGRSQRGNLKALLRFD